MNSNHILCKTNNVEVHIEAGSQVPSFRLPCVVLIFYMFALFVTLIFYMFALFVTQTYVGELEERGSQDDFWL